MDELKYEVSDEEMTLLARALDKMLGDERPDFYGELKAAAWNILHENPGTEYGDWVAMLIEQYPAEIVDALGSRPEDVYAELSDMWDSMDYEDPETGEFHTFRDWAEYFATDRSVELYDRLTEARAKIRRLEAREFQNHTDLHPTMQNASDDQI